MTLGAIARRLRPWCPECDLPVLADSHTHHPDGCGIDTDGCTCPLVHAWCCPTCNPETAA